MIVHSLMVYLCDKQKECKNSRSCGVFSNHTTDPEMYTGKYVYEQMSIEEFLGEVDR